MIKMMQEPIGVPTCFSTGGGKHSTERSTVIRASSTGTPQSLNMSIYRAKIGSDARLVSITWCKNMLLHGLSVSVDGQYECKVELKPWKKQGSKQLVLERGRNVGIVWDLKAAKFHGEVEPRSDYYVALVYDSEVVLIVGDMKKDAFRKTACRPALIDPVLVSRKQHLFAKNRFSTRVVFHQTGLTHDVSVECHSRSNTDVDNTEMNIRIDGELATQVKHLQWKFRGNESIEVKETKLEVFWDVHDWLFGSGPRHAMFLFKSSPASSQPSSLSVMPVSGNADDQEFTLFLYAWKVE
ncbi:hypothetical protein RND81_07G198500 [Saponaria officinalis]|uniref:Uncharacterized protein n=1 Tax=Saponaria officinalis TaxID=3572 RepID=A0AAW1JUA7_SAPOF